MKRLNTFLMRETRPTNSLLMPPSPNSSKSRTSISPFYTTPIITELDSNKSLRKPRPIWLGTRLVKRKSQENLSHYSTTNVSVTNFSFDPLNKDKRLLMSSNSWNKTSLVMLPVPEQLLNSDRSPKPKSSLLLINLELTAMSSTLVKSKPSYNWPTLTVVKPQPPKTVNPVLLNLKPNKTKMVPREEEVPSPNNSLPFLMTYTLELLNPSLTKNKLKFKPLGNSQCGTSLNVTFRLSSSEAEVANLVAEHTRKSVYADRCATV